MAELDTAAPQDEDGITVEIVPDDGQATEAGAEGAGAPKVVSPDEGMAALRAQLEENAREKDQAAARAKTAEAQAAQAGRDVQASRAQVIDSRIGQVDSAIETMRVKGAETRTAYSAALAAGDYDKVAEIQEQMTENTVTLRQLAANKAALEQVKKQPVPQSQAQRPAAADPLETFLRAQPPKAQAWLRQRTDFVTDPQKNKRLVAAHHTALLDHEEGSDGYFTAVEKNLGIGSDKATETAPRRAAAVAAPVSRGAPSLTRAPAAQQTVRLSAAEVRMAEAQGMTAKEWAVEKARFQADKAAGVTEH